VSSDPGGYPRTPVAWRPSYRLVPSRFPPVGLFDRVAAPEDLEDVLALEGMTNPRIREEAGEISLIPPEERVVGPGTTPIMAAFTHLQPGGSRFSDGSFGVYYCAAGIETAIHETVYHRERFLAASGEPPQMIEMRLYQAALAGELIVLENEAGSGTLLHPDSYAASAAFGAEARRQGADGIRYPSVRHHAGTCAAAFRPRCLGRATQSRHFGYRWNGRSITDVIELRASGVRPHETP